MCGICGQLNFKHEEPADPPLLEAMKNSIIHRGPDDHGTFIDGPLGFGFRRLSIIDLSLGHQPMSDQDKTVWVVFNGEIYNFLELRKELEAKGCVFQTNCDTEVIVHGYKVWGDDALQRFNGMFGLAIWDVKKRRLLLARDKSGIKLIYYKIQDGCLYFGSEIRPVLAAVKNKAELDPTALQLFFRYRYTPSPLTLYRGIMKLPAGTAMTVENGKVQIKRFWQFRPKPFSPPPSEEEAKEKLIALYRTAVRRQLMADVPLGLLLSGGFDSALLLALITQEGGKRQTFTVGYGAEHDPDDELDDAAKTARAFGSEHHSIRIDQSAFNKLLPEVVNILEEPVATASIIPMYFVCQCARQNVKVALVGQGPDELFGGYNRHLGIQAGAWWRKLPGWTRSLVREAARNVPRREGLKRGLRSLDQPDRVQRFLEVFALLPENDLSELFRPGLLTGDSGVTLRECWSELEPGLANLDELSAFKYLEIASSLPDELLMYTDKLSMHHSLEIRVPYLDEDIVDYSIRLPDKYKVRGLTRKWLHREVAKGILPAEVAQRRKRGFASTIVDHWYRSVAGGKSANHLADEKSLIFKYLSHEKVQALLRAHQSGESDNHKILFSMIFIEEWLRNNPVKLA
ncbi:MAG TPA: asparagine synthase (glutamine-hydrolyzing) [Verrucomicrobiae bacterium]